MTPEQLRRILQRPVSLLTIESAAAAGELADLLPTPFFAHVAAVYARLELTAGGASDVWPLKLAVLVHEEPPERARAMLVRAGFADVSELIGRVLTGFGAIWKVDTPEEIATFVRSEARHLAELLRFEVAHEGAATPAMRRAAEIAGLAAELDRWTRRQCEGDHAE